MRAVDARRAWTAAGAAGGGTFPQPQAAPIAAVNTDTSTDTANINSANIATATAATTSRGTSGNHNSIKDSTELKPSSAPTHWFRTMFRNNERAYDDCKFVYIVIGVYLCMCILGNCPNMASTCACLGSIETRHVSLTDHLCLCLVLVCTHSRCGCGGFVPH